MCLSSLELFLNFVYLFFVTIPIGFFRFLVSNDMYIDPLEIRPNKPNI